MVTSQELSDLLKSVSVRAVAAESGMSIYTIYRLRKQKNSPTLATVERLLSAVRKVKATSTAI